MTTLPCQAQESDISVINGTEIKRQVFPKTSLRSDYIFEFNYPFKEIKLRTSDGINLQTLIFFSMKSKGVILYLHGSNGAADVWGKIAPIYTKCGYDFCLLDYRGYGKSEGEVVSEEQLCRDVQLLYDILKSQYGEKQIVVIGQSIGTGAAAFLAAHNRPRMLILQAPYYSIEDWIHHLAPTLRIVNNPFKFKTYKRLERTTCPVVLLHGDADDAIYHGSSEKLSKCLKPNDQFITLTGEKHTDFTKNQQYLELLEKLLK